MGRSRSCSRSRSRDRRRSRSRSRSPPRGDGAGLAAQQAALAALAQQQAMQRQLMTQQMMLQQQAAAAAPPMPIVIPKVVVPPSALPGLAVTVTGAVGDRRQREIYIGNLAIGQVDGSMLREAFNAVLGTMLHDPENNPPVIEVKLDSSGRFAFIEVRTIELADAAMSLDKMELCGRSINVGRPKGYAEHMASIQSTMKMQQAQAFAAALSGGATNVVLLENLTEAGEIRDDDERQGLYEDVFAEVVKCGSLAGIAIPPPPSHVGDNEPCRVYIKYLQQDDAVKCKQMMDGRQFDDRTVKAAYTTEIDYGRAVAGEWIPVGTPLVAPS